LQGSFLKDGFASGTGLAPNEAAGTVSLAQTPQQVQLQAIGQWGVRVTPLELVKAYRTLALLHTDHNVKLEPLFAGLQQVVSYGTGHAAQSAGMAIAGKTGTAVADEGPWTHAWFAGYAPADDPKIALVVFLEKGHGGSDAAAVAHEIFDGFANSQASKRPRGEER
jgi:cell division protein FtsI/penicillin-binding protein 2